MLIELELVGVRVELPHNQPIVLLKEQTGFRFLPIWIGAPEATSIAFALQGVAMPRPLTHDLLRNVLADLVRQRRADRGHRVARRNVLRRDRTGARAARRSRCRRDLRMRSR